MSGDTTAALERTAGFSEEELKAMSAAELLEAYLRTGDASLKWPLALRYVGLVKYIALQYAGVYSSFAQVDDILHEGLITLLGAIDKYDPGKEAEFSTYVNRRIRGMVIDFARKQGWIPRNVLRLARENDRAMDALTCSLGRYPSEQEMADYLGIPVEKYRKNAAAVALGSVVSLEARMYPAGTGGAQHELPSADPEEQPEAALENQELHRVLAEGIGKLTENEQLVLSLFYERGLFMKDIAQVMGVSKPRISELHGRAIEKLRDYVTAYLHDTQPKLSSNTKPGKKS